MSFVEEAAHYILTFLVTGARAMSVLHPGCIGTSILVLLKVQASM